MGIIIMLDGITISKILKILECIVWVFCGTLSYSELGSRERVVFLNVGQGDSILIQNDSFEVLVDGGGDDSIVYKMGKYMHWNDKVIDVVVITHMHDDHYMGIKYLLERYDVGIFVISVNCQELCSEFREYDHIDVQMGDVISYGDIQLNILWPRVGVLDENINNDSVVILVEWLDKRILLMGDAELEVEEILLDRYDLGIEGIDVLKAGHHCSRTASSYRFLTTVNPRFVVCSCGEDNKFGHPHIETIENFNKLGIDYILTWEYGDYVVE